MLFRSPAPVNSGSLAVKLAGLASGRCCACCTSCCWRTASCCHQFPQHNPFLVDLLLDLTQLCGIHPLADLLDPLLPTVTIRPLGSAPQPSRRTVEPLTTGIPNSLFSFNSDFCRRGEHAQIQVFIFFRQNGICSTAWLQNNKTVQSCTRMLTCAN